MRRSRGRAFFYIGFIVLCFNLIHCVLSAPLPEDYYAGTGKIAGGNPPSVPVIIFTKSQLSFDFTASIDPESGSEVATYNVYTYSGVPQKYYQSRDNAAVLTSPAPRSYSLPAAVDGTNTVIITGFDGNRESGVTDQNRIIFTWP